jgi:hypothetical protein
MSTNDENVNVFENVDKLNKWLKRNLHHNLRGVLVFCLEYIGDIKILTELLKDKRTNINELVKGKTPLSNACDLFDYNATKILLDHGAELDDRAIEIMSIYKEFSEIKEILRLFKWHIKFLKEYDLPKYDSIEIIWLLKQMNIVQDITDIIINKLFIT